MGFGLILRFTLVDKCSQNDKNRSMKHTLVGSWYGWIPSKLKLDDVWYSNCDGV